MGRKVNTITLTEEQRSYLELQTRARTIQAQLFTDILFLSTEYTL